MSSHLNSSDELRKILKDNKVVFIKWSTKTCPPCKAIQPLYDQLAQSYKGKALFVCLDANNDKFEEWADRVNSVPRFEVYVNGSLQKDFVVGADATKLEKLVKNFTV